ncbi:MAG: hypothetical protein QHH02_07225, partial [Syntrophomonadaceae bacterium]|nr:hypothetical protein [Syntrophomonadaceae bacterium]
MCGVFHNLLIRGASQSRGNNLLDEANTSGEHPSPRLPQEFTITQKSTGIKQNLYTAHKIVAIKINQVQWEQRDYQEVLPMKRIIIPNAE